MRSLHIGNICVGSVGFFSAQIRPYRGLYTGKVEGQPVRTLKPTVIVMPIAEMTCNLFHLRSPVTLQAFSFRNLVEAWQAEQKPLRANEKKNKRKQILAGKRRMPTRGKPSLNGMAVGLALMLTPVWKMGHGCFCQSEQS